MKKTILLVILGMIIGATAYAGYQVSVSVSVPMIYKFSTTTDSFILETNGRVFITTGNDVHVNGKACKF